MKKPVFRLISLLVMAVAASLQRVSLLFPSSVLTAISLILLTAMVHALLSPLMMICELTPCSTCSLTSFRISPASTTTELVPSPTSASCDRAMSTRIRAAGWTMSKSYRMLVEREYKRPIENKSEVKKEGCYRGVGLARQPPLTFITVAPSLVMVCLPFSSTINKSPP